MTNVLKFEALKFELSKVGTIEVIKNDYVFTLLLRRSKDSLESNRTPLKVLGMVSDYVEDSKLNIEVFKNDSDYILLILKP